MAITDEQLIDAGLKVGLILNAEIDQLRQRARKQRTSALAMILSHYRFPVTSLYRAVAETRNLPYKSIGEWKVEKDLLKKLPSSLVKRKLLLPVKVGNTPHLLISDPFDTVGIDGALRIIGQVLPRVMSDPQTLRQAINSALPEPTQHVQAVEETDVISLLDAIIREAYLCRASDIHLLSEEKGLRVRFRVDGKLLEHPVDANNSVSGSLISRVKVLADLDISEQRQPQDGGFAYHLKAPVNMGLNFRVATAPTRSGERITMRVLAQHTQQISLQDLGMLERDLNRFAEAIKNPYGMILLTGPTGSGKSTTLFAALQEINHPDINIMTVENPIEYVIPGISQLQTGPKVSFAEALRSFLRHDPDVLMVGEIRDHETADVAVKAAMTGHLVFSTLHTNNAVSAVTRLIDIGCEAFLIGSTMTAVIAQRLVRKLCTNCCETRDATPQELEEMNLSAPLTIHIPKGCAACQGTGYQGRLGLFETLWFDERLARLVAQGADEETIEHVAGSALKFMWEDGVEKVKLGLTTLEEVKKVTIRKSAHAREAVA